MDQLITILWELIIYTDKRGKMKNKTIKKITLFFTSFILLIGIYFIGFYIVKQQQPKTSSTTTERKVKKANKNYYKGKIYKISTNALFDGYPDDFEKLVQKGKMTIQGTVIDLKDSSVTKSPTIAFTMATIKVDNVLAGDKSKLNKTIKVLFQGGNMAKNVLLKDMADKQYLDSEQKKDAQSSEVVTVKYSDSPLPQIDQKLALILNRVPMGANGVINEECYSPVFAGKGVFIKNSNNVYQREEEPKPQGGGESSPTDKITRSGVSEEGDDEKMNQGMNALIQSK